MSINLSTDGNGDINFWNISAQNSYGSIVQSGCFPQLTPCGGDYATVYGPCLMCTYKNDSPGAWTLVPEPTTGLLVMAGVLGLAVARRA